MNSTQAQGVVVGALAASGAIVAANALTEGHAPDFRQVVGFSFVAVGLATAALVAPEVAGAMSLLILTSSVFIYGGPALDAITGITGGTPAAAAAAPTAPTHLNA